MLEAIADVQHAIWAHWMTYMFTQGTYNPDGSWTMPADKVERWTRQLNTPYAELPEQEKESDRNQAMRVIGRIRTVSTDVLNAVDELRNEMEEARIRQESFTSALDWRVNYLTELMEGKTGAM